ncbi:hypothetical protein HBB16_05180 [Pseudonocardia sp. MCCB 268]|nr:hypothetical protein [Pseudonocardia cytotoxica]
MRAPEDVAAGAPGGRTPQPVPAPRPGPSCAGSWTAPARGRSGRRWHVDRTGLWYSVTPPEVVLPAQGWKLHLSATPAHAREVLARALPVLLDSGARRRSAFKFLATTPTWSGRTPATPRAAARGSS